MYHSRSGDPYERSFSPGGVHSHSHSTPKSKGPMKKSVVVSNSTADLYYDATNQTLGCGSVFPTSNTMLCYATGVYDSTP